LTRRSPANITTRENAIEVNVRSIMHKAKIFVAASSFSGSIYEKSYFNVAVMTAMDKIEEYTANMPISVGSYIRVMIGRVNMPINCASTVPLPITMAPL
jgi:N-methylhydantoinase B/oxoprolinase/acetone carboxylase alpha subunit